ncbi:hypothetical protein OH76DRAFT_605875 [Lentinus brumalis]|uniref:Uncharacterized protein n=1 Tax=Lentinus brumalis TaxID=2498619 RepID=A0A371DUL2_9APHY|nr:hypothetical protein OH76DRAFT_605875 [Polyporus brumalis]
MGTRGHHGGSKSLHASKRTTRSLWKFSGAGDPLLARSPRTRAPRPESVAVMHSARSTVPSARLPGQVPRNNGDSPRRPEIIEFASRHIPLSADPSTIRLPLGWGCTVFELYVP